MNASEVSGQELAADQKRQKKLITMIELKKPVSQMTEEEVAELACHVVGQVREKVPKQPKPPKQS